MTPRLTQVVEMATTPTQLRNLADNLERRWRQTHPGGEVPSVRYWGEGYEVVFVIDQTQMGIERKAGVTV